MCIPATNVRRSHETNQFCHVIFQTGSIPSALATNPNLETLDVKGNRMSVLPDEWISGYPSVVNSSLVNVRISFNNFSGAFPTALASAPQLTFLVLNNNTLRCAALIPPVLWGEEINDPGFQVGWKLL